MNTDRASRFEGLYESAYPKVLAFVRRRHSNEAAEDVVAEVFTTAWRRFDDLPSHDAAVMAWLYSTARSVLLNTGRSEKRRTALHVKIASQPSTAGLDNGAVEAELDLIRAWRTLRAVDQEALALITWEHLDTSTAAAVLGITPVAYRVRLGRARRALRNALEPAESPALQLNPARRNS